VGLFDDRRTNPTDLGETASTSSDREIRFRCKVVAIPDPRWSHAVVVDYRPGKRWSSDGLTVIITAKADLWRLQATGQVAAYSLAAGQGVFISRPGIGSLERLSSVYGAGSEVALRFRLRLAEGLCLLGYYGEPWLRERRMYVGLQLVTR
jgi:hypothetical protein